MLGTPMRAYRCCFVFATRWHAQFAGPIQSLPTPAEHVVTLNDDGGTVCLTFAYQYFQPITRSTLAYGGLFIGFNPLSINHQPFTINPSTPQPLKNPRDPSQPLATPHPPDLAFYGGCTKHVGGMDESRMVTNLFNLFRHVFRREV